MKRKYFAALLVVDFLLMFSSYFPVALSLCLLALLGVFSAFLVIRI